MEKRALIAILLCFVVFFGYTKVVQVIYPNYGKSASSKETLVAGSNSAGSPQALGPASADSPAGPLAAKVTGSAPVDDKPLAIDLPKYKAVYSTNAAAFTEIRLTDYPDNEGGPFTFLKSTSGKTGVGAIDTILVDAEALASPDFETTREGRTLHSTANAGKILVEKTWNFSNDAFGQNFSVALTNRSDAPVKVRYRLLAGTHPVVHNTIDEQYIEANWLTASKLTHIRRPKADKPRDLSEPVIAASMKTRHFSSIFKPLQTSGTFSAHVEAYDKKDFGSYLVRSEAVIQPGETLRDEFLWYVGPNRVEDLGPYELDRLVNFGKLDFVAKLVLGGLHMFAGVVKNYGIAIILLTIFTNILFMPLTKTSFMSMRRMQLVQPAVNKLREKYKDNPTKLNEEMMALYKKHKVNPMGGCLPMLLQMPIFMGLYVSLSKAPELLGGKFLWIHDLASPDRVPLPMTLPLVGNNLHLLPLIMVAAMVFQQKISMAPAPADDPNLVMQQKMMGTIMPIMFGFIFYPMPSGLVIYWLTNTCVMMAYQTFLKKTNPITPIAATA